MNASTSALILVLALTAALPANAAEPTAQTPGIVIDCAAPALPSQQEVSVLTGIENYGQAYAARARLMQQGLRACKRGAKHVVIVNQPSSPQKLPAIASIDDRR